VIEREFYIGLRVEKLLFFSFDWGRDREMLESDEEPGRVQDYEGMNRKAVFIFP